MEDEKISDSSNDKLEGTVNMLIEMRKQARDNKNFALSDQIRDQLIALGIQLKDGKEGTTFICLIATRTNCKNKVTFYITIQNMLSKIIVYPLLVRFYQVAFPFYTCSL
jgi:hypothetical protein